MKLYRVSVGARSDLDAIARVQAVVRAHGSYSDFSALPVERARLG